MNRTPEDALRDVLHGAGDAVGPGSFDDVRARARKLDRRSRRLKTGAAAVVVLAGIGVAIPLLDSDDKEQPVITNPGPDRSTTSTFRDGAYELRGAIWPYTSGREADDKQIDPGFNTTDPIEVATRFLQVFAGMEADSVHELENSGREANIAAEVGNHRTVLALRKLGTSDRWTVVSATADGLMLSTPGAGQAVTSPIHVEGRASAFEGTVLVKVTDRAKAPNELGTGVLTGEMGELKPFEGEVEFQPGEMEVGAVIAFTTSAEDGSVEQLAAVPVLWQPGEYADVLPVGEALADDELVAVLNREIEGDPDAQDVVVLGTDGSVHRRLLKDLGTAEGGVLDISVTDDRKTVVVAWATSACTSSVTAIAADGSGEERDLGAGDRAAVSPDGHWLAVVVRDGCDDHDFIEIRDLLREAPSQRFDSAHAEDRAQIGQLAWVDNDRIVFDVHEDDGVSLHLIKPDVDHLVLRAASERVSWSQPEREEDGDIWVWLSSGTVEYLDPSTWKTANVGYETASTVTSHTEYGGVSYWLTTDQVLHTSDGDVLRRDVSMIAS